MPPRHETLTVSDLGLTDGASIGGVMPVCIEKQAKKFEPLTEAERNLRKLDAKVLADGACRDADPSLFTPPSYKKKVLIDLNVKTRPKKSAENVRLEKNVSNKQLLGETNTL